MNTPADAAVETTQEVGELPVVENPHLVQKVTNLLAANGHPQPAFWEAGVHEHAHVVCDDKIQRFLINRYWREFLGGLEIDTINARYCLLDPKECSVEDWLRTFEEGVVEFVVKHQIGVLH